MTNLYYDVKTILYAPNGSRISIGETLEIFNLIMGLIHLVGGEVPYFRLYPGPGGTWTYGWGWFTVE